MGKKRRRTKQTPGTGTPSPSIRTEEEMEQQGLPIMDIPPQEEAGARDEQRFDLNKATVKRLAKENKHEELEQFLKQLESEIKNTKYGNEPEKMPEMFRLEGIAQDALEELVIKKAEQASQEAVEQQGLPVMDSEQHFDLNEATIDRLEEENNSDDLKTFLKQLESEIVKTEYVNERQKIAELYALRGVAQHSLKKLNAKKLEKNSQESVRMVNVDYKIDTPMLHSFDFNLFLACVLSLFEWHTEATVMLKYMAPCRPLVQSSGMGKTKLLWELTKLVLSKEDTRFTNCVCAMILCMNDTPKEAVGEGHVFSYLLKVPPNAYEADSSNICKQLDYILEQIVNGQSEKKVILLFDESQHLLKNDGFAFRSARWWLRRKREKKQVVAVFTGTTSKLTNFFKDPPNPTTSRLPVGYSYHNSGESSYPPFCNVSTIGLYSHSLQPTATITNEYQKAVPYGRPLFALMQEDTKLTDNAEYTALSRMLLKNVEDWSDNLATCLSILGTRLQMGQTSVQLASELVAKGYAVLSSYDVPRPGRDGTAFIFFPTDPVCARLAMALTDETWEATDPNGPKKPSVRGLDRTFWTKKMSELISIGLCHPPQGDVGELLAAAYLLFCGDILRKRIDKKYRTFSVPLAAFFDCLLRPGEFSEASKKNEPLPSLVSPRDAKSRGKYTEAHVNFIQVTRNYIRFSVEKFFHEGFLRDMYLSGSAFFTFPGFTTFDLVASIKLSNSDSGKECFVPMMVSVSTIQEISTQSSWLKTIREVLAADQDTLSYEDVKKAFSAQRKEKAKGAAASKAEDVTDQDDAVAASKGEDGMGQDDAAVAFKAEDDAAGTDQVDVNASAPPPKPIKGPDGKGFVGIRLLFDRSEEGYKSKTTFLSVDDVDRLLDGEVVWKVVIVPKDDPFGIIDVLADATVCGSPKTEIYSSHSYLYTHGVQEIGSSALVRKKDADVETVKYLDDMRQELLKSRILAQLVPSTSATAPAHTVQTND